MIRRAIVQIDEARCNGCGLCITACHEGALELIDGKARLVADQYCDGLGACLPQCPTGAITIIERDALPFDEAAVQGRQRAGRVAAPCALEPSHAEAAPPGRSALGQWPVQLQLVSPEAPFFDDADVLLAADCAAYACGSFHETFMRGRVTLIGCPKLDDSRLYIAKLAHIMANHDIRSVTVTRMEVPCCGGLLVIVQRAAAIVGREIPIHEVIIGIDGSIRSLNRR
ncbi:MAG: 4Fe-4S binding protein [Anaerolineae bacterium]